jgi:hypothetical protein
MISHDTVPLRRAVGPLLNVAAHYCRAADCPALQGLIHHMASLRLTVRLLAGWPMGSY